MITQELSKYIPDTGIILIIGQRGSGKSVLAYSILEYLHQKRSHKNLLVYNFPKPEILPDFIQPIYDINFPENSVVLIDEAYIEFSARSAMSKKNKMVDMLNGLARQKDLLIIYITQDSTRIDINIIRSADVLMIKKLSKRQIEFERKEIKSWLSKIKSALDSVKDYKKSVYIDYDTDQEYSGVITDCITLPSFWSEDISKSWRGIAISQKPKNNKKDINMLSKHEIDQILRTEKFQKIFNLVESEISKENFKSFKDWFDYCIQTALNRFFN